MQFMISWIGILLLAISSLAAQEIPPGTVLPVMLSSTLDARHDQPGEAISGKIMQDVPLPDGTKIPRGAKVTGHVVSVSTASAGSPSQLTLKFDQVRFDDKRIAIAPQLRALASMNEVYEARMPTNAWDDYGTSLADWNTVQIGGAGVFRGNGEVIGDGKVVGRATFYGAVTARLMAAPERGCPAGGEHEQALWKFSPWACGTYGLRAVKIVQSSDAAEIVLQSSDNLRIQGGSGWLLVNGGACSAK